MISTGQKSIFYIDSQNSITSFNGSGSFTVKVDMPPNNTYNRIVVLQACIPKSYYLVQAGYNNFNLLEQDMIPANNLLNQTVLVSIPSGNYTKNAFIIALTSALNAASPHRYIYSITYPASSETNTGKLTYSVSAQNHTPLDAQHQPQFIFNLTSNINYQMGFNKNKSYIFNNNTVLSQNVIKLQSKDTIFIKSNVVSSSTDSVLQEIYSAVPDFSDIIYNQNSIELNSKELIYNSNNITFTITDEDDVPLDLNGQNCVFSVCCFEANNSLDIMKQNILIKNMEKIFSNTTL